MNKKQNTDNKKRKPSNAPLTADEAEKLFATVDETGHTNEKVAKKERKRRKKKGVGIKVDPLSGKDPSGSNVGNVITKTAVSFVVIILVVITVAQVGCGAIRRFTTANLSTNVTVESVASALRGGVEWGGGFTQFPENFSVQEADENTGRIDVTVVETAGENEMEAMAGSYIQATAFSTNALLNPKINTVIYRVNVHEDANGNIEKSQFFGFLQPTGAIKQFMTFIFTKATTANGGFNIFCTITGLDEETTNRLRDKISSPIPFVSGDDSQDATDGASGTSGGAAVQGGAGDSGSGSAKTGQSTSDKTPNSTARTDGANLGAQ